MKQHFSLPGQSVSSLQVLLQGSKVYRNLLLGQTPGLAAGKEKDSCPRGLSGPRTPPATPLAALTWHRPHALHVAAHAAALLVALAVAVAGAVHQADGHHVGVQPWAETCLCWRCAVGSGPCQPLPARTHTQPNPAPGSAGGEQRAPLGPPTRGAESGGDGVQGPHTSPCGGCPRRQSSEEPRPAHPSPVPGRGAGAGSTQLTPTQRAEHGLPQGHRGLQGDGTPSPSMGILHSVPQPLLQQSSLPGQFSCVEQKLPQSLLEVLLGAGHSPSFPRRARGGGYSRQAEPPAQAQPPPSLAPAASSSSESRSRAALGTQRPAAVRVHEAMQGTCWKRRCSESHWRCSKAATTPYSSTAAPALRAGFGV